MKPLPRIAIVVAAMITGGCFAGVLADDFYLPSAGPAREAWSAKRPLC